MPLNARPGDHLVMGNHRAQYTRSGWALLEQGASLNLPLGPVRRGKVSRFLVKITAGRASERYPECRDETARVLVPDSEHCRGNAAPGREVLKASEQALAPPARQKHKH
jgi:hypothetical protein